ncbi:MAG: S8 family serine peptidase, partial [Planctomycetota bacterium]
MKNLKLKKLILSIAIAIVAGVFLSAEIGHAEEKPQYVLNEIIVKYTPEAAGVIGSDTNQSFIPSQVSDPKLASLDKLNKKYKVKKFNQIFPHFKKNQEKLKALKKKDESLLTKKEKHLLRRLKRAPKDAKKPALDRIYKLTLEEGQSVEEAVAEYSGHPDVEYAQLNYIYEINMIPDDPYYQSSGSWGQSYDDLWGLKPDKLHCEPAWDIAQGEGIVVAVIDTGVDYNHEDIQGNVWHNAY